MKKIIVLGTAAVLALGITSTVFANDIFPGKQTASAYLDQEGTEVQVTMDLSDGYSAEFAHGAVYLYDGPNDGDTDPVAIGLTLESDVYYEYISGAEEQPDFRTEDGIIFYTEEDGTQDYFFEVGADAFFMISVNSEADGHAVMSRIAVEQTGLGSEDPFTSEVFTEQDINEAMSKILGEFIGWNGCELHDIDYAGDDFNNKENIAWLNDIAGRDDFTQCIKFVMSFHSPVKAEDLEGTAWEPDTEYTDYEWWLARTDGGEWEAVTWGY